VFEQTLERARNLYGFYVTGYVVMPEHVHLLISEPATRKLAVAIQMLKQNVAGELNRGFHTVPKAKRNSFWLARYYDFNVFSEEKIVEKLKYMHCNPVARGLVERPEDWEWSSCRHYASGLRGVVEIESRWTALQRERTG
jgi:putative transposase